MQNRRDNGINRDDLLNQSLVMFPKAPCWDQYCFLVHFHSTVIQEYVTNTYIFLLLCMKVYFL